MIDPHDHVTAELQGITPRWLQLLRQAVRDAGKGGVSKAASQLLKPASSPSSVGKTYHRSYVSQVIHGHLAPHKVSPHFCASVLAAFGSGRVECPHLGTDIAPGECRTYAVLTWGQVRGTGDERLAQWKACQDCLNNPANQPKPQVSPA